MPGTHDAGDVVADSVQHSCRSPEEQVWSQVFSDALGSRFTEVRALEASHIFI